MQRARFTEEQIIGILKHAEVSMKIVYFAAHGTSDATTGVPRTASLSRCLAMDFSITSRSKTCYESNVDKKTDTEAIYDKLTYVVDHLHAHAQRLRVAERR